MNDANAVKGLIPALEVRLTSGDFPNITVRDYLRMLLSAVWKKGESFNGKRPFGNSGWEYDLYDPLVIGGFIRGSVDENGCVEVFDEKEAHAYVGSLISAAFHVV